MAVTKDKSADKLMNKEDENEHLTFNSPAYDEVNHSIINMQFININ